MLQIYLKWKFLYYELIPSEEGGYIVYCAELDIIDGETVDEAVAMLKDAASCYITLKQLVLKTSLISLKDIRSRDWNL